MSLEDLAGFYRKTGRVALLVGGGLWVGETHLSTMTQPGAIPVNPSAKELRGLLWRMRRMAAVFACDWDTGMVAYAHVLRDRQYGMHSLQRQFRQQTRLALDACCVRPMRWDELAKSGLAVNRDTQERRGTNRPLYTDPLQWSRFCSAANETPGLEVSGCFTLAGDLAAYMTTWIHDKICHGLQLAWSSTHRHLHPTHALYFETARERISRSSIEAFMLGRQALPAMERVDQFKRHAGFLPEPRRIAVILHPLLHSCLLHPASLHLLRKLRQRLNLRSSPLHNLDVIEAASRTHIPPHTLPRP